jgi:hypothetical protein
MRRDFRRGCAARKKIVDSHAVNAHVGVVRVAEQANDRFAARQEGMMHLEFNVFRVSAAEVRVQIDAVGHLGHQRFRKPHGPVAVVVLHHRGIRVAARVRGVIVGAVVVERPIHELEIAVRAVRVQIEKIHQAEFSEANLEAPHRQLREERQRSSLGGCFLTAERNDLMPHQASRIGSLAEQRIAHHVQIRKARNAQRLPDPVPAGFLDIAEKFSRGIDPHSRKQSQHAGRSVLSFRRKAVRSLVGRTKRGVPLRNNICLPGKPEAVRLKMRE